MEDYSRYSTRPKPRWGRIAYVYIILGLVLLNLVLLNIGGCGVAEAAEGLASYYTVESCKREGTSGTYTATGERYDEGAFTCALPWKPDGKEYMVYAHETGRSIVVRHNDFGPGRGPRAKGVVIDLTPAGWKALGYKTLDQRGGRGHIEVSYQPVY